MYFLKYVIDELKQHFSILSQTTLFAETGALLTPSDTKARQHTDRCTMRHALIPYAGTFGTGLDAPHTRKWTVLSVSGEYGCHG